MKKYTIRNCRYVLNGGIKEVEVKKETGKSICVDGYKYSKEVYYDEYYDEP